MFGHFYEIFCYFRDFRSFSGNSGESTWPLASYDKKFFYVPRKQETAKRGGASAQIRGALRTQSELNKLNIWVHWFSCTKNGLVQVGWRLIKVENWDNKNYKRHTGSEKRLRELRVVFGKLRIEITTFLENCESTVFMMKYFSSELLYLLCPPLYYTYELHISERMIIRLSDPAPFMKISKALFWCKTLKNRGSEILFK